MASESTPADARQIAPLAHTFVLVGLISVVALTGSLLTHFAPTLPVVRVAPTRSRALTQYAPLLLANLALVMYVSRLFLPRNMLADLVGTGWSSFGRAVCDLALGIATAWLIQSIEAGPIAALHVGRNAAISGLLPSTGAERLTWAVVGSAVGFCEEVVYRGYLQRQLAVFTGRSWLGVALSALLFGLAHLEQGIARAIAIAGYGLILGAVAHYRRSLIPGIVSHAAIDVASAFVR